MSEFYLHRGKPRSRCRLCHLAEGRIRRDNKLSDYRKNSREQVRARRAENPELLRINNLKKYGLSPEEYDNILKAQGGVCAICGGVNANGRRLSVDHDHSCCDFSGSSKPTCGKCNRGLLCQPCNLMLGYVEGKSHLVEEAIRYLKEYA